MYYHSPGKSAWFLQTNYLVFLADQTFTKCLSRTPEKDKFENLALCVYSGRFLFSWYQELMISDAEKWNSKVLCVRKDTIIDQRLSQTQENFR